MVDENKFNIKELPVMTPVATKIIQLQEENLEISFRELEKIILLDPAITARILKVANSALYARQKEITNLQQAITLLGFKTIKSMILLICASNVYGKTKDLVKNVKSPFITKASPIEMWKHLVLTAFIAKQIAVKVKYKEKQEEIFIAGLLHDIGRIVLMLNELNKYGQFFKMIHEDLKSDILSIEEKVFGYTHLDVGKYVLEKWNFPSELIDVIFQHHSEHVDSPYKKSIIIVGLGNIYSKAIIDEELRQTNIDLKEKYISELSLSPELDDYFTNQYMEEVMEDEFYKMSIQMS